MGMTFRYGRKHYYDETTSTEIEFNGKKVSVVYPSNPAPEWASLFGGNYSPKEWHWDTRRVDIDVEEFEAETVAWLVTKRFGVRDSKSVEYLAHYVDAHAEIPEVSIDAIMRAVSDIEKMLKPISVKDSFLYKKSELFKHSVDEMIAAENANKPAGIRRVREMFRRG